MTSLIALHKYAFKSQKRTAVNLPAINKRRWFIYPCNRLLVLSAICVSSRAFLQQSIASNFSYSNRKRSSTSATSYAQNKNLPSNPISNHNPSLYPLCTSSIMTTSTSAPLSLKGTDDDDSHDKEKYSEFSEKLLSTELPQKNENLISQDDVESEVIKSDEVVFNPDTKTGFWGEIEEDKTTDHDNKEKGIESVNEGTEMNKDRSIISPNESDIGGNSDWDSKKIKTHYIFLVHGWLGNDSEMSYIEKALQNAIGDIPKSNDGEIPRFAIHKVKENNGNTTDGIRKGGSRLANEIVDFIRNDCIEAIKSNATGGPTDLSSSGSGRKRYDVSISFIGNSLGGLYSRYAISVLPTELDAWIPSNSKGNSSESIMATKISLHSNIFCTTVTPHLGVASHTYVPLPRFAEQVVGRTMNTTGKHLFRLDKDGSSFDEDEEERTEKTDLIYQMSTDYGEFLEPLSRFRKRVAYANAYGTDFQVPTNTASFVSVDSDYPHRIVKSSLSVEAGEEDEEEPFIVTAVATDQNEDNMKGVHCRKKDKNAILTMSNNLDAVGWLKVFVDVRDRVPGPSIKVSKNNRRQDWDEFIKSKDLAAAEKFNSKLGKTVKSKDLARLMKGSESMNFPLGHSVMVANSKSKMYRRLNSKGKPVMDKLGKDVVKYIMSSESIK